MKDEQKSLINMLIVKSITKKEFMNKFGVDKKDMIQFINTNLENAYEEKNPENIGLLLYIIFEYDFISELYIEILCKILYSKWHYEHENIAMIFNELKSPKTIKSLYDTAVTQFDYLNYDDSYALAVKCIWALGKINVPEAHEKLKILAKSVNKIIKECAIEQLNRIKE